LADNHSLGDVQDVVYVTAITNTLGQGYMPTLLVGDSPANRPNDIRFVINVINVRPRLIGVSVFPHN